MSIDTELLRKLRECTFQPFTILKRGNRSNLVGCHTHLQLRNGVRDVNESSLEKYNRSSRSESRTRGSMTLRHLQQSSVPHSRNVYRRLENPGEHPPNGEGCPWWIEPQYWKLSNSNNNQRCWECQTPAACFSHACEKSFMERERTCLGSGWNFSSREGVRKPS